MRRIFIFLLICCAIALLFGCEKSNLERVAGAWICDSMATLALPKNVNFAVSLDATQDEAIKLLDSTSLNFAIDKKQLIFRMESLSEEYTFTVASDTGNTLNLKFMDKSTTKVAHITFLKNDTLTVSISSEPTKRYDSAPLIFIRKK